MNTTTTFAQAYLKTWIEPDVDRRHQHVRAIWAADGTMAISSIGATLVGVDQIIEHIDRVHDDLVAGKGVTFDYTQEVTVADATLLTSTVSTPDGNVVGKGADVIRRDEGGRVTAAYMFMGLA